MSCSTRPTASILTLMFVVAGCAAPPAARNGATAAAELQRFGDFLRDAHPAPFRFVDEAEFDALLDDESARLRASDEPTELELGRAFQRVAARLRDAHLRITLPSFQSGHPDAPTVLPFALVKAVEGWLVDASNDASLPVGARIVAIDEVAIDDVVATLGPLVIAEGHNEDAASAALARDFAKLYLFAYGARESHAIAFESDDGAMAAVRLASVDLAQYPALAATRRSLAIRRTPSEPWPSVVVEADGTPRILLPSFGVPDEAAYGARLDEVVAQVAAAPRLILDLRGNEGGLRTHGIRLANHLATAPYVQWLSRAARVRAIPARYRDAVEGAFGIPLDGLRAFPETRVDGLFRLDGDPLADRMVPAEPHLAPELVVLVDGLTGSAANELALALRTIRPDATFVGEEIGGGCDRHVGELPVTYTTETYGVIALVSLLELTHVPTPGCEAGRGMRPDVAVRTDTAHFEASRDVGVEAALAVFAAE